MQLPVTLPISGTLDSNIYEKTYAVTKQSAKTMKLLPQNERHILGLQEYFNNPEMHPLVRYTNTTKYLAFHRSTMARVLQMAKYPKNYLAKFRMCYVPMATLLFLIALWC